MGILPLRWFGEPECDDLGTQDQYQSSNRTQKARQDFVQE